MSGFYMAAQLLLGLGLTAQMSAEIIIKNKIQAMLEKHKAEFQLITSLYKLIQKTFNTNPLNNQFKQLDNLSTKIYSMISQNMNHTLQMSQFIFQRYKKIRQNQKQVNGTDIAITVVFPLFVTGMFVEYMVGQFNVKFQGFLNPKQQLGIALKLGLQKTRLVQRGLSPAQIEVELIQRGQTLRQNPEQFTFSKLVSDGCANFKNNIWKTMGKSIMIALRLTMFVFGAFAFFNGFQSLSNLKNHQLNLEKQLGPGGKIQQDELAIMQIVSMLVIEASNLLIQGYNLIKEFRNAYDLLLILVPSMHQKIEKEANKVEPQNYVQGFNIQYVNKISELSVNLYSSYLKTKIKYNQSTDQELKRSLLVNQLTYIKTQIEGIKDSYASVISKLTSKLQDNSIFLSFSFDIYLKQMNHYRSFISELYAAFQTREKYFKIQFDKNRQRIEYLKEIDKQIMQLHIIPTYIRNLINPQYPVDKNLPTIFGKFEKDDFFTRLEDRDKFYKNNIAKKVSAFTNEFYYDDPTGKTLFGISIQNINGPTKEALMNNIKRKYFPGVVPIPQNLYKEQDPDAQNNGKMLSTKQFLNILYKLDKRYDPNDKDHQFTILSTMRCNRISQTYSKGPEVKISVVKQNGQIEEQCKKINILLFQRCLIIQAEKIQQIQTWEEKMKAKKAQDLALPRPSPQINLLTTDQNGKWGILPKQA